MLVSLPISSASADELASYAAPPADESPKPFSYQYAVDDTPSNNNFQKQETQDAYGTVKGSFTIALPADGQNGFTAEVSYKGMAQYPAEPAGGYGYGGR